MCTNIIEKAPVTGAGRGAGAPGWFKVSEVAVSYDHPFRVSLEHAVNIDFTNPSADVGARLAVELTIESARELAKVLLATVDRAELYEETGIGA
jgi:hypothetical protein